MCTAMTLSSPRPLFGRNLDLERSLGEEIVILPRGRTLSWRDAPEGDRHYAMTGAALPVRGYPLFFDAVNEHGLAMAGLNFPGNARWHPRREGMLNVAPFEFIPFLLRNCRSVAQARPLLTRINLIDEPFSPQLPLSPLHWMLADRTDCVVIESTAQGLAVYDNPVGVLTNNPPFPWHMTRLCDFMALSPEPPENRFAPALPLQPYSRAMGALGLPGDWSSASRFVRAAFVLRHSRCADAEEAAVVQFFRLLSAVGMPRGSVALPGGDMETTVYSACCSLDDGVYYYAVYDNPRIAAVDMHLENLDAGDLLRFPMNAGPAILRQNKKEPELFRFP